MSDVAYLSPPLAIEERFLDYNGHVNMAYHLVLADQAMEHAFEPIKGDGYVERRRMTTFSVEVHVRYLREINRDDEIRGRVRFVGSDEKRVHWAVELVRGADQEVVTTVEGVSLSIDLAARRVAPFPPDVSTRLGDTVAGDAEGSAALGWLGGQVALSRRLTSA